MAEDIQIPVCPMSSINATPLLHLLQLVSPALPVGAYSYSEGIETLVQFDHITTAANLEDWLTQELHYGTIRLESALLKRVYASVHTGDFSQLRHWNQWVSAFRETEELREQSWQMGRSLVRLLQALNPSQTTGTGQQVVEQKANRLDEWIEACGEPCNFVVAFGLAAANWQIDVHSTVLGYLHSWAGNLVNAGVRLVPLGQTQGQQLLLNLYPQLEQTTNQVLSLTEEELWNCSWGLTIASMNHETLYSRLFRS
jgi:urease accessory protein